MNHRASLSDRTLGILGGMGPMSTVNFMRLLITEFNNNGISDDCDFPRMVMLGLPLKDWGTIGATNKASVARQVDDGIEYLRRLGARTICVPCNSVHEFIDANNDDDIVSIVDATLKLCRPGPIAVLCSQQSRWADLYGRSGREVWYHPDQSGIDEAIESVLVGNPAHITKLMVWAQASGAGTVILGCTELSLCPYSAALHPPIVDSSYALAKAVVEGML